MQIIKSNYVSGGLVKSWASIIDDNSAEQLARTAGMPFVYRWVAAMPDVHLGKGATVGSVIPTLGAIMPAAVGVDIGCGMTAQRLDVGASDLIRGNLAEIRHAIEANIPHGRTANGGHGDRGAWGTIPEDVQRMWDTYLAESLQQNKTLHDLVNNSNSINHLGTLGTGNHFIEVCVDEEGEVWLMLHSGSRGVGNKIGQYFIKEAQNEMERYFIQLPDKDLAYLVEGTALFNDYTASLIWAQTFARVNREIMRRRAIAAIEQVVGRGVQMLANWKLYFQTHTIIDCHHNYVAREHHYGRNVWVTRKGAIRARCGDLGIIPGSMGAKSYITRGLGNAEAFCSSSHGAGRVMTRNAARKLYSASDVESQTAGIECRKDEGVVDELPCCYKPIDQVMEDQKDLVEVLHTLTQIINIKG